jgi:hypothetical protein
VIGAYRDAVLPGALDVPLETGVFGELIALGAFDPRESNAGLRN